MSRNWIARGDIFYIHKYAPVCGSEQEAGRPGIIVSNDLCNQCSDTVEIVYLTSKQKKELPTHVDINSARYPSIALCEQITTVSVSRIGDRCGKATEEEMCEVNEALRISIALKEAENTVKNIVIENQRGGTLERDSELATAIAERDVYKRLYESLLDRIMGGQIDGRTVQPVFGV